MKLTSTRALLPGLLPALVLTLVATFLTGIRLRGLFRAAWHLQLLDA